MPGYKHKLFSIEYRNIRNSEYNSLIPLIFYFKHIQRHATNHISFEKPSLGPPLLSRLREQLVVAAWH